MFFVVTRSPNCPVIHKTSLSRYLITLPRSRRAKDPVFYVRERFYCGGMKLYVCYTCHRSLVVFKEIVCWANNCIQTARTSATWTKTQYSTWILNAILFFFLENCVHSWCNFAAEGLKMLSSYRKRVVTFHRSSYKQFVWRQRPYDRGVQWLHLWVHHQACCCASIRLEVKNLRT